jgi:dTDP-glucose 4,6-dehydratase
MLHRGPAAFVDTNGTFTLLEAARAYRRGARRVPLPARLDRRGLRTRSATTGRFDESTPYDPRSPYSASKAGSDHLVRAWRRPTACRDDHELLEQLRPVPVPREADPADDPERARGPAAAGLRRRLNVRDWLYVDDHVDALLAHARAGQGRRDLPDRRARRATQPGRRPDDLPAVDELAPPLRAGHARRSSTS